MAISVFTDGFNADDIHPADHQSPADECFARIDDQMQPVQIGGTLFISHGDSPHWEAWKIIPGAPPTDITIAFGGPTNNFLYAAVLNGYYWRPRRMDILRTTGANLFGPPANLECMSRVNDSALPPGDMLNPDYIETDRPYIQVAERDGHDVLYVSYGQPDMPVGGGHRARLLISFPADTANRQAGDFTSVGWLNNRPPINDPNVYTEGLLSFV